MVQTLILINRRILFTIPGRMMSIIGRGEKGKRGWFVLGGGRQIKVSVVGILIMAVQELFTWWVKLL